MFANVSEKRVEVVISERNLRTMYACMKTGLQNGLHRKLDDGTFMSIRVEPDADHYKDRSDAEKAGRKEIDALLKVANV